MSQLFTSIYTCVYIAAAATATDGRSGAWLLNQNLCNSKGLDRLRKVIGMAKKSINRRGPTAVDTHVGQKMRARRIFLRMSQTEVADAAGISFQQIQKYENGTNRVGASRLYQISNALGVSPFYFFEGAPTFGKKKPAPNEGELPGDEIVSFLATREGAALVRGFLAVKEKSIRQNLIGFIATLKGN